MNLSAIEKNKIKISSGLYPNLIEKIINGIGTTKGSSYLIIDQNITIFNNTIIDFLAIDQQGKPVAFIKSIDSNHFFEKYLDFSLWLNKIDSQMVNTLSESKFHRSIETIYEEKFQKPFVNIYPTEHRIILITENINIQIKELLDSLIYNFKIPINALIIEHEKNDQEEYILQSWYIPEVNETNISNQTISSWDDCYLLDIPIIDKQHKLFFKIYDDLLKSDPASIEDKQKLIAIEHLKNYIIGHFQTEELLLKRANYADKEQHIKEHILFINKTNEFKQSFDYKNTQLLNQMLDFIRKWFLSHISGSDAQYKNNIIEYINHLT